jgi:predicted anti-sigma-YlaC factor YlaD
MLTCRQLIDFLDDYIEGKLPPMRAAAFKVHLMLCRDCRQYLDTYRHTIEISKQVMQSDQPVPADVPPELIKAIRENISK